GSLIGGMKETQEMLDFCGKHNITCDIEKIDATPETIKEAYDRTVKADMVHLFSLAVITLAFIYAIESAVFKTPVACSPVKCPGGKPKTCPYGYQKAKDGCDICKCNDP
ncbi:unnamed protein product, partial [Adineta steineri]